MACRRPLQSTPQDCDCACGIWLLGGKPPAYASSLHRETLLFVQPVERFNGTRGCGALVGASTVPGFALLYVMIVELALSCVRQIKRMPRHRFNRKRRIDSTRSESELAMLAGRVTYGGNPQHKRRPGNFGLNPPAAPGPTSQCVISARQERT